MRVSIINKQATDFQKVRVKGWFAAVEFDPFPRIANFSRFSDKALNGFDRDIFIHLCRGLGAERAAVVALYVADVSDSNFQKTKIRLVYHF